MVNTIDMQDMRYLNLFEKITGVRTRLCFKYNNGIIFCVPKYFVLKAAGENGRNLKKINSILGKRIKVIPIPRDIRDAENFIRSVISPTTFKAMKIEGNEIAITGGSNKAALIGRNKTRLFEMQKISKDFFGKDFKIV